MAISPLGFVCSWYTARLLCSPTSPGSLQLSYLAVALLLVRSVLDLDLPPAAAQSAFASALRVTEEVVAFTSSLTPDDLRGYFTACEPYSHRFFRTHLIRDRFCFPFFDMSYSACAACAAGRSFRSGRRSAVAARPSPAPSFHFGFVQREEVCPFIRVRRFGLGSGTTAHSLVGQEYPGARHCSGTILACRRVWWFLGDSSCSTF